MTEPHTILNLDGYTDLPPGKVAAIVTYLEMRVPPRLSNTPAPSGWTLQAIGADVERYRTLYRRIGEPWLWFSRAVMPEAELAAIIGDPKVKAFALHDGTGDVGLLELDFRSDREAELAFLGLATGIIGKGTGRFLIEEAIRRAFAEPIRRFFVHTCTLDHPGALAFYRRAGFKPYKRAIEVADDPRLAGFLPRDSADHVPDLDER
ncbi:GNAT family N-acetyltransferase [Microvirga sp. 2YAF29]|uniref:GNAT family N-acetyltransferase n=1 Tax=Microvirga sp. 2YAF29 TaxID=3233031 RepID=UPI003F9C4D13